MAETEPPGSRSPTEEYEKRRAERQIAVEGYQTSARRIGNLRLGIFILGVAVTWFSAAHAGGVAVPGLAALVLLTALFIRGDRLDKRIRIAKRTVHYYDRALDRVRTRRNPLGEPGARYLDASHPYATDLDLFGQSSLFQLISVCRTRAGEDRLAEWLLNPADVEEIASRHSAVQELRPLLDLREDLAALGAEFGAEGSAEILRKWATAPPILVPTGTRVLGAVCSVFATALLFWCLATLATGGGAIPRIGLAVVGGLEAALFYRWRGVVNRIVETSGDPAQGIALLRDVLARIERQEFRSERLQRLAASLCTPASASESIGRLNRLIEMLDSRETWALRIAGPLVLWTTQVSFALERWRQRNGAAIPAWLHAVADFEALNSFAAASFEHPEDTFPQVLAAPPLFDAVDLAHPLLQDCVPNDLMLRGESAIAIVSGSNMSGKSTLLRTVGINAVLALAGSPVRARCLRISVLHVGAAIRTADSLEDGISRFYAEILRIRRILELPAPVLFLLDELLAGTNSHDRKIGAEAVLHRLAERGALGLATTHDLALAAIADSTPGARNVHFEDKITAGRIRFDYRLHSGVVTHSNALELMRSVGLDV